MAAKLELAWWRTTKDPKLTAQQCGPFEKAFATYLELRAKCLPRVPNKTRKSDYPAAVEALDKQLLPATAALQKAIQQTHSATANSLHDLEMLAKTDRSLLLTAGVNYDRDLIAFTNDLTEKVQKLERAISEQLRKELLVPATLAATRAKNLTPKLSSMKPDEANKASEELAADAKKAPDWLKEAQDLLSTFVREAEGYQKPKHGFHPDDAKPRLESIIKSAGERVKEAQEIVKELTTAVTTLKGSAEVAVKNVEAIEEKAEADEERKKRILELRKLFFDKFRELQQLKPKLDLLEVQVNKGLKEPGGSAGKSKVKDYTAELKRIRDGRKKLAEQWKKPHEESAKLKDNDLTKRAAEVHRIDFAMSTIELKVEGAIKKLETSK